MWGLPLPTLVLMVLGPVLFLIALFFSVRARQFTWPNIAVIGIAIVALLIPSIQRFSIGKDAVSFELFEQGAETSRDALEALQKSNEKNAQAIMALGEAVEEIKATYGKLASGPPGLRDDSGSPGQPRTTPEQQRLDSGITRKLDQAQQSIQSAAPLNEAARAKIRDIDKLLRQAR